MYYSGKSADRADLTDAELSAACQVYVDWTTDTALNLNALIVDDDGLTRSAELLDGEYAGSESAALADDLFMQGVSITAILTRVDDEFGTSERAVAEAFLVDRAEPPSDSAESEYVVYAANRNRSNGLLVRRSIDPVSTLTDTRGGHMIDLRRLDGTEVEVDSEWCNG